MTASTRCPVCGGPIDQIPFTILAASGDVIANGRTLRLTPRELSVLLEIVAHQPHAVDAATLHRQVWNGVAGGYRTAVTTTGRLRVRLAEIGIDLVTIRKRGYALAGNIKPVIERDVVAVGKRRR